MAPTLHPRQQQTPMSARLPPDIPSDPTISDKLGIYLRNFALWCREGFAEQMRNNQALQGLMLRGYNAPAGTNANVYILQVGNGGGLWLTPMALGNGELGTPFLAGSINFQSLYGVTDGSNAPAGQVGEYISASGNVGLVTTVYTNIASISLTAGDWEVSGAIKLISSVGSTNVQGGLTTTSGGGAQDIVVVGPANTFYYAAVPTKRFSITATTTVYLVGYVVFASGTASTNGYLQARRMR